jgi:hypothetical protein
LEKNEFLPVRLPPGNSSEFQAAEVLLFSRQKTSETSCGLYLRKSGNYEDFRRLHQQLDFGSRNRKAYKISYYLVASRLCALAHANSHHILGGDIIPQKAACQKT